MSVQSNSHCIWIKRKCRVGDLSLKINIRSGCRGPGWNGCRHWRTLTMLVFRFLTQVATIVMKWKSFQNISTITATFLGYGGEDKKRWRSIGSPVWSQVGNPLILEWCWCHFMQVCGRCMHQNCAEACQKRLFIDGMMESPVINRLKVRPPSPCNDGYDVNKEWK